VLHQCPFVLQLPEAGNPGVETCSNLMPILDCNLFNAFIVGYIEHYLILWNDTKFALANMSFFSGRNMKNGGKAPLTPNLINIWRWVVSFKLSVLYTLYPLNGRFEAGLVVSEKRKIIICMLEIEP